MGCSSGHKVKSGPMKPAASMHAEGYGLRPENTDYDSMTMKDLLDQKKYDIIVKKYAGCDTLKPHELSIVGEAYYFMREDKKAIKFFDKAIEAGMDKPHTYYYRAGSCEALGQYDKALKSYKAVIGLNPNDFQAYNSMCHLYLEMNLPDSALAYGERILKLHKNGNECPNLLLGIIPKVYLHKGEIEKALAKIDEIAPLIPADENERAIFLNLKFNIYAYELKDTLNACKVFTDFVNDNPESYLSIRLPSEL